MSNYAYVCNHCDWPFEFREAESDAWADGVEHYNQTQHEGGEVKPWGEHPHHHKHHEHHGHGHGHEQHGHEEPHIF